MGEGRDGGLGFRANGRTQLFYDVMQIDNLHHIPASATVLYQDAGADASATHLPPRTKQRLSEKWIVKTSPGVSLVGRNYTPGRGGVKADRLGSLGIPVISPRILGCESAANARALTPQNAGANRGNSQGDFVFQNWR